MLRILLSTLALCALVSCGAQPGLEAELAPIACASDADCATCEMCSAGTCAPRPAGTPCGEQRTGGPCDVPDQCDGAGACITIKPVGTVCRASAHPVCDPDDVCDGKRLLCPGRIAAPGTPCGGGMKCGLTGLCR